MAAEGFFVGKGELLAWINGTLGLRLASIEETGSGAVACQLMDALHPGQVPLKKVDFNAKNDYERIANYKVLQDVFTKLHIDKHIEVQKLIKGKPLDNIEFMQWMKMYFDQRGGVEGYEGETRRALCKTGDYKSAAPSGAGAARKPAAARPGALRTGPVPNGGIPAANYANAKPFNKKLGTGGSDRSDGASAELAQQVETWKAKAISVEKEKEFYYSKLRSIEVLCQLAEVQLLMEEAGAHELASANPTFGAQILKRIEGILYASTVVEGEAIVADVHRALDAEALHDEAQQAEEAHGLLQSEPLQTPAGDWGEGIDDPVAREA